jgi:uncharacterized protein
VLDAAPLLRRRRWVVALGLAAALAAAPGLARLELDNAPEGFFVDDHRELTRYRELLGSFGSDRAVRVVASGPGLWTGRGLAWLGGLEARIGDLPGVVAAAGLRRHHAAAGARWPPDDPLALRARATADPLDRGAGWVSADGAQAGLLVVLARPPALGAETALAAIEALAGAAPPGVTATVAGLPVVERAVDRDVAAMTTRFLPLLALLLLAAVALLLRRPRQVAAVALLVVLAEVVTLGAMGASGARLDVVTALLVPLLAVVATATGVHLVVRFRHLRARGLDAPAAARELVRLKAWPVVWAGLTTAAGFASLAAARLPAVRSLGLWAAFGFAWTTLAALTVLPCLLAGEDGGEAPRRRAASGAAGRRWTAAAHRLGRRCAVAATARPRLVYAAFAAVALLAAAGLPRLEVESDSLAFLAPEHPVRRELAALAEAGIGGAAAHLVVELPRGTDGGFDDRDRVARLGEVAERLRRHPLALGAVSAADVAADGGLRPFFVGADPRRARVTLSLPMGGAAALDDLFASARAAASAAFPEGETFVTGSYPLVLRAQRELLAAMLVTVGVAVLLVAAMLRVLAGSTALAWRMLLPNLWPVLVAVGVMGWARVPLDSSTVAVAAVALGLVVDDSLHTFADFRCRAAGRGPRRAAVAALTVNAPAHLATALLLAGGFALVGFSGFVPAARFGALTAAAVAAALAGDLLLLPALLASAPRPGGAPSGGAAVGSQDPGAAEEQRQHQEGETERGEGGDRQHGQALSEPVAAAADELALLDDERAGPGVGGGAVEAGLAEHRAEQRAEDLLPVEAALDRRGHLRGAALGARDEHQVDGAGHLAAGLLHLAVAGVDAGRLLFRQARVGLHRPAAVEVLGGDRWRQGDDTRDEEEQDEGAGEGVSQDRLLLGWGLVRLGVGLGVGSSIAARSEPPGAGAVAFPLRRVSNLP